MHKGRNRGLALQGSKVSFGEFGFEGRWPRSYDRSGQIEAGREQ